MKVETDPERTERLLTRGVDDVLVRDHLTAALRGKRPLRVKLGIDPTSPDLHLGHAVLLRKLRQFQDLGHTAILLIGDFTARIGDPSGRSETRPVLSEREVRANASTYLAQAGTIVDVKRAEIRKNSEWYRKDGLETLLTVARGVTLQQVLKREDFGQRIEAGADVSMLESLYPLLQGYDSVALEADVELGGTDQTFNLLMGRHVQRIFKESEQDVVTLPLLEGTDGVRKMSKSYGNAIALADAPNEMFGKVMSVPDALTKKYFELLTDLEMPRAQNPRDAKLTLAFEIVQAFHSPRAADAAREEWIRVFSKKERPEEAPTLKIDELWDMTRLVVEAIGGSKSSAWRLIQGGSVKRNNAVLSKNPKEPLANLRLESGDILQIGKHRFFKIR